MHTESISRDRQGHAVLGRFHHAAGRFAPAAVTGVTPVGDDNVPCSMPRRATGSSFGTVAARTIAALPILFAPWPRANPLPIAHWRNWWLQRRR